ncbi:MAG TPA: leucine--tRNA ligase [Patescibacteria group bacterium]|nr:leucine--tRNA ligase [Patescibacteria group bacterium]
MKRYNPKEIEPKWQQAWADNKIYQAKDQSEKPKKYVLEYFPYPSGAAMHVGHVRNYTIGDVIARHARMSGYNVMHPMGWDAFGLPAENYAIKNGISPQEAIKENTAKFKRQLIQMGFSYDWSREINSSDPEYYRWTQWLFLLLHKRGLAYQKESLQWWCPIDKTVLANEQVENGQCWRCGSQVEKKALKQWFFKITEYADRLVKDLDDVNWSDALKNMQRNWIGRSKGAEVDFRVANSDQIIKVFTTRPDTLFGATFMVVAPENPIVKKIVTEEQAQEVGDYIKQSQAKSDVERQETKREKTGVFTGAYAINPVNGQRIPVWIADYVLFGYGTGAIMAVPAHDERDHDFAKTFNLDIKPVIEIADKNSELPYHGEGVMINSGPYNNMRTEEVREKIVADLEEKGVGKERVNYKIRDWLISRQRYWGAPIPMVHCPRCGTVPVPEDQLPVKLPEMTSFEPSGDGRSPLARVPEFVNTVCPKCGGPAERETDTMDGFACSSWYFLRYTDPHNQERAFDDAKAKYWMPVDDYIGGAEHAVMHLLYTRFWFKVMQDEGLIDFGEPIKTLRNHGMILAPDGQKMSKSKGNTIEPDGLIEQGYGADAIRIMELFIGPWNQSANWSVEGLGGSFRFLQRVWSLSQDVIGTEDGQDKVDATEIRRITHQAIKKVSQDLQNLSFNTAIAAMMEAVNAYYAQKTKVPFDQAPATWRWACTTLAQLLAPFAPHITEELWSQMGLQGSIHTAKWPEFDEKYLEQDTMTIAVQINGKLRAQIEVPSDATKEQILETAKANQKAAAHLSGKELKKSIYITGKLVSFVIS